MPRTTKHLASVAEQTFKRFFAACEEERAFLLLQLQDIDNDTDRQYYTSLLFQRLFFTYFLQKHCLLDDDPDYLVHRLQEIQQQGPDRFFRQYLLPLFHDGLGTTTTTSFSLMRFGKIPLLGLRIFRQHPLEARYSTLQLSDNAFLRLFMLFERYHWSLHSVPSLRQEKELTPDILAYFFERGINQKKMGAYYTTTDVSHYIVHNTLLPCLLEDMENKTPNLFMQEKGFWHLLQNQPERYLPLALHTTEVLPTETQEEYVLRKERYRRLCTQLESGNIRSIHELVTNHINIQQLLIDSLAQCTSLDALLTFYCSLQEITILDPTCGPGALLLAALDLLEPLYTTSLRRIQSLRMTNTSLIESKTASLRAKQTVETDALQSILTYNLYGVDLMPEAVEICQLRLLLRYLATVTDTAEITISPDLDQHIRCGNTLIGFLDTQEVDTMASSDLKTALNRKCARQYAIEADRFASEEEYEQVLNSWMNSHRPFHWSVEFATIMQSGGFSAVIGNPPYIEYSRVRQEYTLPGKIQYGNLYAAVTERALQLCQVKGGYLGLIVPLSLCGTERFATLRQTLLAQTSQLWLSHFEIFPSRLFEGAFQRLSLLLAQRATSTQNTVHVTRLQRWYAAERRHLIDLITYTSLPPSMLSTTFPKLATSQHLRILEKLAHVSRGHRLENVLSPQRSDHFIFYQEATNYWIKAICHIPFYKKNGIMMEPPHGRFLFFHNLQAARSTMALMNSSLFYLWFSTYSDGFHLTHTLVKDFPLADDLLESKMLAELSFLLEEEAHAHAQKSTRNTRHKTGSSQVSHKIELEEYHLRLSKPLLDRIDTIIAKYYHFTDEELDFIIHYDHKYRIGQNNSSEVFSTASATITSVTFSEEQ